MFYGTYNILQNILVYSHIQYECEEDYVQYCHPT